MTRREEREQAFCLIFEEQFDSGDIESLLETAADERDYEMSEYITSTVRGVLENKDEIDKIITKHSSGWNISRLSKVSLSILRLAVYEVKYNSDVPESAAINEAVELAKTYDTEDAPAFINGILGSFSREDKE